MAASAAIAAAGAAKDQLLFPVAASAAIAAVGAAKDRKRMAIAKEAPWQGQKCSVVKNHLLRCPTCEIGLTLSLVVLLNNGLSGGKPYAPHSCSYILFVCLLQLHA